MLTAVAVSVTAQFLPAAERDGQFRLTDRIPYGQSPVDYLGDETSDAVSALNARLVDGSARLEFDDRGGYLRSLLEVLGVPVESQLLVFSRTALNPKLVGPDNPRAVYFNDEISVAWVPGAAALEVAAVDPVKGAVFYTLPQVDDGSPIRFRREQRCLACHAGPTALQVPGLMFRSFLTDADGEPTSGYSQVTHATPLSRRLAGWYVTGTHGGQSHLGNLVGPDDERRRNVDPAFGGNVTDLSDRFDTSLHLSPHSDLVAHLVLSHQAHGINLLIRAGQEQRLGLRSDAQEQVVRYLLFADEAPLTDAVAGTSGYREWFERQGPTDPRGRSLREFDLQTRLFKYRLSYLVYSRLFDGLPDEVKQRVYARLWEILAREEPPNGFGHLADDERRAIVEILRATKADLPAVWMEMARDQGQ